MDVVRDDVEKLVHKELQAAIEIHGLHNSHHEAYAVIKEELEEAEEELEMCKIRLKDMWCKVRDNDRFKADDLKDRIVESATKLAVEAIQVAAMAKKGVHNELD